jgi:hypothetical protein
VTLVEPVAAYPNAIRRGGLFMIAALLLPVIGVGVSTLRRWLGILLVAALPNALWCQRQPRGRRPDAFLYIVY